MQSRQLYINDELTELSDQSPIALTLQVNDLANISDRQSSYSNSIKIPKTENNSRILGFPNKDSFTQRQPYTVLKSKYIETGIEINSKGEAILNSATENYELNLTFGLSGINDLIANKTLQDLDLSGFGPVARYNVSDIAASQTKKYGWIVPVVDYGQLSESSIIDIQYLRPAWFHRTLIDSIGELTGYTFTGSIFSDDAYLSELVMFSNDEYLDASNGAVNLPDIDLKDFLKDFMQAYFLTPVVDNVKKTIVFRSFDELYFNKSRAKDWTLKFVRAEQNTKFTIPGYAQVNAVKYKEDTGVAKYYADGFFSIDNTTLLPTKDVVTRVFSATEMVIKMDTVNVASIKRIANFAQSHEFQTGVQPRNLYNATTKSTSGFWQFTNGSTTVNSYEISTPYFELQGRKGLVWSELLARYGYCFLRLIRKIRVETKEALLSPLDIYNFDFFTPVYDANESQYYYVNQIQNWQAGKSCKVKLIRM